MIFRRQERSLSSCLHEELSAEARCAHFVAVEEESRKAQEALRCGRGFWGGKTF
jgi:hypothetical protein